MATPLSADRLLTALKAEGCKVVEYKSWRTHNRNHKGPWGPVNGVMIHHTVTSGTDSSVALCYNGHSTLPGPLCHTVGAKNGTLYMVGHGRANHAGSGDDDVLKAVVNETKLPADNEANTDGNRHFYGIELVNLGDGEDPWPEAQVAAAARWAAALCRAHGWNAESVIGHKEWQPGKVDPRGIDMDAFRGRVEKLLAAPPEAQADPKLPVIVPKSRETAATMAAQAAKALTAWPFIPEVERKHGLPAGLLLAVGSRETNLTNKTGDKGHGRGVWQRDDRWWPIPDDYATNVLQQATDAATLLAKNHGELQKRGYEDANWGFTAVTYNKGLQGTLDALAAGKNPDTLTPGGDYGADVLGRLAHLKPTPTTPKEPTVPSTYSEVWEQDRAPAPTTSTTVKTNKKWKPISFLREIFDQGSRTHERLDRIEAKLDQLSKGA